MGDPLFTIEGISHADDPKKRRYMLQLRYSQGLAQLELPVTEPGGAEVPGTEAARRALEWFLQDAQTAVQSPTGIAWPYRR